MGNRALGDLGEQIVLAIGVLVSEQPGFAVHINELLDQIVEAGTYAATGMGAQSPIIAAVTNKNIRDRLSRMNAGIMGTGTDPFYGAPVVLVVLADRNRSTYLYDGSLVIGNMMLAAHDLGLGSCWIHRAKEEFDSPEGKALLKEWGIEGDY